VHEALSGGSSAGEKGQAYVILVYFFKTQAYYFEPPKKRQHMLVWPFFMNTRSKLGLHAQTLAPKPQPLPVLFRVLANKARTKKGECRAHVAKGHMNDFWHRLRPLLAAPLGVRRRYLIEVPSPLPAAPLVVRRTVLWPLCRCALLVFNRDAQADARPAVRAHASTVRARLSKRRSLDYLT
jgi:hypothetical protein